MKQTIFYNDEDEFSNNIGKYFSKISMIERYKNAFELTSQDLTLFNKYTVTTEEYRVNNDAVMDYADIPGI